MKITLFGECTRIQKTRTTTPERKTSRSGQFLGWMVDEQRRTIVLKKICQIELKKGVTLFQSVFFFSFFCKSKKIYFYNSNKENKNYFYFIVLSSDDKLCKVK